MYSLSRDVEEEETGEGGADGDEDWIEPGKISNRRKRDKNSPKRYGIVGMILFDKAIFQFDKAI